MLTGLRAVAAALLIALSVAPAQAQSVQLWPELSAFLRLNNRARLYFLSTRVRESRDSSEVEIGPNLDIYLQPIRHRLFRAFSLDESKNQVLMLRAGYRYLHSYTGDPDEHRAVLEATARYPLVGGVLFSQRFRTDLRSIDGEESWRFRTRLSLEKEFSIGRVTVNPYVRGEVFYDSRVDAWSRTELIGGAAFPVSRRLEFEAYFDFQNDTGGDPNRQVQAIGGVLNLYF